MAAVVVPESKVAELEACLPDVSDLLELGRWTLADAIREGSLVTSQALGEFSDGRESACALSAAHLAVRARHML